MDSCMSKYEAFLKTVQLKNLTRAAEDMGYSQPNLSHLISGLEKDWGISLLERSRSGISLTADGKRLLPYIQDVFSAHEELLHQVNDINGLQSGLIRIGIFQSVATQWLPTIISAFRDDYPHIDYELHLGNYSQIEEMMADGLIDCGFTSLPLPASQKFDITPLAKDELFAVIPANHPLANEDRFPLSAFNDPDYPFMVIDQGRDSEVEMLFKEHNVKPHKQIVTWDDVAIMAMVETGLGISILNELVLKVCPFNVKILPLDVPAFRSIGLITKNKKKLPLAVKYFLEYLDLIPQNE